jgi:hypothetical protein
MKQSRKFNQLKRILNLNSTNLAFYLFSHDRIDLYDIVVETEVVEENPGLAAKRASLEIKL